MYGLLYYERGIRVMYSEVTPYNITCRLQTPYFGIFIQIFIWLYHGYILQNYVFISCHFFQSFHSYFYCGGGSSPRHLRFGLRLLWLRLGLKLLWLRLRLGLRLFWLWLGWRLIWLGFRNWWQISIFHNWDR